MAETTPSAPGVALDEALAAGVPPTWTEAVALIRAIVVELERGAPSILIPTIAQIFVLPTGHISLHGTRVDSRGPVAGVGQVMQKILDQRSSPAQLLDVQQQALADPSPYTSLRDLHDALTFFARPDPQGELAGYYNRASRALENVVRDQAFDLLKQKAKEGAEEPRPEQPVVPPRWRRRVALAATVVALLVVASATWRYYGDARLWLGGTGRRAATSAVEKITVAASQATTAARGAVSGLLGTPPAAPPPAPAPAPTPAPRPARPRGGSSPAAAGSASGAASAATAATPGVRPSAERISLPEVPAPMAETAREPVPLIQTIVYSSADADVQPPVLVRPQLPKKLPEGVSNDRPGNLHLLVLEDGTVGEAQLIPASNRLQDRLLISASKAWQFRPAQRSGQPVKYRILIPITW